MNNGVPTIDISPWFEGDEAVRAGIAKAVDQACAEWGFLVVKGHGIDPTLMEGIAAVTREFFNLPVKQKLDVAAKGRQGGRGYYPVASKSHARTRDDASAPGDLRETFFSGRQPLGDAYTSAEAALPHFAPNLWPERPAAMERLWTSYTEACDRCAGALMQICAQALNLPTQWFEDKIDRPISTLTAQYYPPLDRPPLPGQVRSGAHTDFGTMTLLMTEDRPGGLQVMGIDGQWHDVKPVPGTFIVNLGDMMARWTNGRWRSTLHRVVNPPLEAGAASERLSVVYFHTPNYDACIECIPSCTDASHPPLYPPILAGEHLTEKLRQVDSVGTERTP